MTWLFAIFLVAHALIHASFVAPQPPATAGGPQWPFDLGHSWILSPLGIDGDVTRALGVALILVTVAGFALAALAAVGILADGTFVPGVAVGSAASLALLAIFFSPWFVVGFGIDAVLLWAVLAARWTPQSGFPG